MGLRWDEGKERMVGGNRVGKSREVDDRMAAHLDDLLYLRSEKNSTSTTCIRIAGVDFVHFAHRWGPLYLAAAGPRKSPSFSHRHDLLRSILSPALSLPWRRRSWVARVAGGTVSCSIIFFLESRGPGTALLTVSWFSQWIAGPLHNASG